MSDFLTRLAGRALATVPVAQPLIPARFTPATEPSEFSEVTELGEERVERERREPVQDTVAADQVPDRMQRRDTLPNTREPAVHANPPLDPGESPRVNGLQAAQSTLRSLEPARATAELPVTAGRLRDERIPLSDSGPRREAVGISALNSTRELARTIPESRAVPAAPNIGDRTARAVPQTLQKAPAPIIRVTIGRVDVRAEFPAPAVPAVKRRAEAQSLSLDDYLKLRNEGKR